MVDGERAGGWTQVVAETIEKLNVADALEQLRGQVDELIGYLADPGDVASPPESQPALGEAKVEAEISALGGKIDAAAGAVAELTDLLEAQTERIETLEAQVGESCADESPLPAEPAPEQPASEAVAAEGARPGLDPLLEERLLALEARISVLERTRLATGAAATGRVSPSPATAEAETGAAGRLAAIEELVEKQVQAAGVRPRKSHPTVLVVDDAPDARTILSIYLSKTGYQVVTAGSAEDCLTKLLHHDVDAVVLEACLPGAGGGHICEVIRKENGFASKRNVPVIVYTAHPERCGRETAGQWGVADYLVKGGDMLPLLTSLVRLTGEPSAAAGEPCA